ncbi:hypothetical protein BUALT_Bualt14G0033700 [Buddleja alternifolia]|uniref:DUF674 domain-containing protein n=1 Tax=Buddleja alternifolia TaxID=168488 RepID=A0AAV6WNL0_9LAMI|nr:hypothetical protein BUALT_Bualt14G0033700 [Buddleja alternifolia]
MAQPKALLTLKLLIDTKGKRVIFAETDKDCVDFLFHILSLPVATVISLLKKQQGIMGSLANLYESIENLNETYYIQPNHTKATLLKPTPPPNPGYSAPLMLLNHAPAPTHQKMFYKCRYNCSASYVSEDPKAVCPGCSSTMSRNMSYVAPQQEGSGEGGYVKGVVTYMVFDDLVVTPLSVTSSLTLLNRFNVEESALEEKVVNLGMDQAIKLLKASLQSKTVLTDVFLEDAVGCKPKVEETYAGSLD